MGFFAAIGAAVAAMGGSGYWWWQKKKKQAGSSDWRGFDAVENIKVDSPEEWRRMQDS